MAANKSRTTLGNGTTIYVSYGTIIGFCTRNGYPTFTDEYYSVTTSKHRNQFIRENNGKIVSAEEFARLRQEAGV
jgi:hypothetical protein